MRLSPSLSSNTHGMVATANPDTVHPAKGTDPWTAGGASETKNARSTAYPIQGLQQHQNIYIHISAKDRHMLAAAASRSSR